MISNSINEISHEETENNPEIKIKKTTNLLTPEEKVLREFNERYAIVRTSTTYILVQKSDASFELDSRHSFLNFHENDFFLTSEGKLKNKAKFWLKHPLRRTFENIVFNPLRPGDYEDNYNIFKGFALNPIQGDCSLYWKHVQEVICSGNLEYYTYVRKWMACVIQKPHLLATALVLRGLQGTGKNKFVEYFGRLFGSHFITVTNLEHITGKFNSHLKYAYLIHANEAIWGGSKREVGAIKALITDPTIIVEGKGKDAVPIDNCRHLIVSSNEDWVVPMDLDDRRFFVLDISTHRKEDIRYFKALELQMIAEGLNALLFDLLHENLTDFDPRKMPANDYGFDMKLKSASSVEKYLYEVLKEGKFNLTPRSDHYSWGSISCERLYSFYKSWTEYEGLKREVSSEFGKRLKKILSVERVRRGASDIRIWGYEFLSLEVSRKAFEAIAKQSSKIWEDC